LRSKEKKSEKEEEEERRRNPMAHYTKLKIENVGVFLTSL
jgi:hypothetical protein